MRFFSLILALFCAGLLATEAEACWWRHHCHCGGQGGRSRAASAPALAASNSAARAATNNQGATVAYTLYQPVAAPAPAQGLNLNLGGLGGLLGIQPQVGGAGGVDIVKLLQVLRELRDRRGGDSDSGGDASGSSDTAKQLTAINAKLAELSAGQAELRGRLINNADVLQRLGAESIRQGRQIDEVREKLDGSDGLLPTIADIRGDLNLIKTKLGITE